MVLDRQLTVLHVQVLVILVNVAYFVRNNPELAEK